MIKQSQQQTKHPAQLYQMRQNREQSSMPKTLKFERIKKQNSIPSSLIHHQSQNFHHHGTDKQLNPHITHRKFIYDQQTMNDMILNLKQENNQLKNIVKIQQTQINYHQSQEKNILMNFNKDHQNIGISENGVAVGQAGGLGKENYKVQINRLEILNYRLRKQVQALEQQMTKMKRTIKHTSIKQLQCTIQVYEQQLKNLTAKLTSFQKSTTNIEQLNKIIQKQYITSLKNKQLQSLIQQKTTQIQQVGRVVRKLKNIISQKNTQIENIKLEKQKIQNTVNKNRNMDQFVPKSQLTSKKKQLLVMAETIEKLQMKLNQCQSKAQSLQQENIDNMNRETTKRKQILTEFQKIKKINQALEQALASSLKKTMSDSLPPLRLDKVSSLDSEFRKLKAPHIVKMEHIREPAQILVYNLQKRGISYEIAPLYIKKQITSLNTQNSQQSPIFSKSDQPEHQTITIRQIIQCLDQQPFTLQSYQQKQLIARYLSQNQSDPTTQHINFDTQINIGYVRSIFKRILHQYPTFTQQQIIQNCILIQDFLRRNQHILKTTLAKMNNNNNNGGGTNLMVNSNINNNINSSINNSVNNSISNNNSNSQRNKKRGFYKCSDYLEAIIKENQLNQLSCQFIKFWIFKDRELYFTFKEFQQLFRVQGATFITQDPQGQGQVN